VHLADATAARLIDTEPDSKRRPGQDPLGDDIVIQRPDRVGADACNECEPADSERRGPELHRLAPDADEQQRQSALRLSLGEPLRTPAEVGEVLGVAPESVRRLERSALQKLGHLVAWLDYVLAHEEPNVGVPLAAIRYFPQRELLASAGAPRRALLQRDRRAVTP
jgi:DNA-binding CsgD family transcriptional regulator